ncbi:phage head spike fiber domain-containing protein [Aeromonas rivipollensis]|uniref:phage head spike fiber domain-containing protein n=1 Tax=Aeromonas rivipollensis TaxID=948519 RepID=UPI001F2822DC|nr:hypothetical protein [Aeromonas rivipollensis]MCE9955584.1 hypothetical protein [Aeromonas rivipollensis]
MAGVWKRDGTVAVTNGNKKVTGTGTTFADTKNGVAKGHLFCITSGTSVDFYEVDYVVSNTELYLVQAYRGVTATGKAYEIITTFSDSVPEFARRLTATLSAYQQQSDAFQALLTSTATTVEVTAPDGTKQTLIPWKRVTSEGEGQAARAKAEADKAAASATLAGGIVEASALPLPDVWAPLSDSLRLLTGFGRDVLVGSDVVARMVNFSRSSTAPYIGKDGLLKTAAVNEPRFEKEGLLLDGQSSNLIPWSRGADYSKNPSYFLTGASAVTNGDALVVTATAINGGVGGVLSGTHEGKTTTVSLWAKGAVGGERLRVGLSTDQLAMPFDVVLTTEWVRYSKTYSIGASDTQQTSIRIYAQNPCTFSIDKVQCELLPFASSYIPTNGAAVARSADLATLPQSLNLGESQLGFSLAVEFDSVNAGAGRLLELSDLSTILTDGASVIIRHAGREVYGINAPLGQRHHLAYSVAADGALTVALNGKLLALQSRSGSYQSSKSTIALGNRLAASDRAIYGHLRDLKIWTKKPLTADQLKVASA